ncbi:MAG TPA: DUF541 domain-containing protein [Gammaproteobacteria bacterium]|nr:DUF541 domain-containing protein [Gammaproteobacteria bacterium]
MSKATGIIALLLLYCFSSGLAADDASSYDRVSLGAEASEEIANDTLVAILYLQQQGRNAAQVAERVNQAIAWGIERARERAAGIKIQTLGYQTSPVYQNGKLTGIWRIRQSLRLESKDSALLSELLGELQERLAIQHIGYQLSEESRGQAEQRLTEAAIASFKRKALLVARQFDARDYRIVSVNISPAGSRGRPIPMRYAMDGMETKMASAPPLEAGEQTVRIGVSGVIELVRD